MTFARFWTMTSSEIKISKNSGKGGGSSGKDRRGKDKDDGGNKGGGWSGRGGGGGFGGGDRGGSGDPVQVYLEEIYVIFGSQAGRSATRMVEVYVMVEVS